ncbi:MAG TPA: disulfide bond formation protein B [Candidatus Saccharimonadales bacterium]|nr:disulfide bond formation protein B [Candidatus Saccharimonadales bacterium]
MKYKQYATYLPYLVLIISLLSALISLFFSEILKFVPCVLCWWQRIFMYPMVFISAVSIMRKQKDLHYYILPLSIIGFLISFYQNLLVWHILPEAIAPCTAGVSCVDQPFVLFGFFTIPLGSMISFAFISICMILYAKLSKDTSEKAVVKTNKTKK